VLGGIKFPIGFFPAFRIPLAALWWGVLIGGTTALAGSIVPAWSARSVKVSEVFAKLS
jgi:putative ABC transport system permease protein